MRIGHIDIQNYKKCLVIGEVGLGHDGSLGAAHAFIDAIAFAGADAVKFQTHIAEEEGTAREKFRVNVFPQDPTRQNYWKRTAFSAEHWQGLKRHAEEKGLIFLSTPFSIQAAVLLEKLDVPAWKISSGDITNTPLLDWVCKTKKPLLVSTGMSPWPEIDSCVDYLKKKAADFLLFQCNNSYPCPAECVGLNILSEFREKYNIPVGLSDHSAKICTGIAAFTLGACAIEVHVTLSRFAFGPDVKASLDVDELAELCSSIRFLEQVFHYPVDKNISAKDMDPMRNLFMKGIVAAKDLSAGRLLKGDDLAFKKPLEGIPASEVHGIIGRRLKVDVRKDEPLHVEDIMNE